jgi:hypothetical protein
LAIRLVVSHGLWDGWVHERDIVVPLGLASVMDDEEIAASLRYVAALSASFTVLFDLATPDAVDLVSREPMLNLRIEITDHVLVSNSTAPETSEVLEGSAVDLLEALSFRSPMPSHTPPAWRTILSGLGEAFDASVV